MKRPKGGVYRRTFDVTQCFMPLAIAGKHSVKLVSLQDLSI